MHDRAMDLTDEMHVRRASLRCVVDTQSCSRASAGTDATPGRCGHGGSFGCSDAEGAALDEDGQTEANQYHGQQQVAPLR
jgi:hypothetical protein